MNKDNIKGILFDYGGTIDTNGTHWGVVLWESYQRFAVPITNERFRAAYVYGERTLATNRIIKPHDTFYDTLLAKITLQFECLITKGFLPVNYSCDSRIDSITDDCYAFARRCTESAAEVLEVLQTKYPMVLVSNFYGNIESVLNDFNLRRFFPDIVESAMVGIRKPDPALFQLGLDRLTLSPEQVMVIGDSVSKDMIPARSLGCSTVWLKGKGWDEEPIQSPADYEISCFSDLLNIL